MELVSYLSSDAMAAGCIPVIAIDHYVLPFEDVIDWQKTSVRLYEGDFSFFFQLGTLGSLDSGTLLW